MTENSLDLVTVARQLREVLSRRGKAQLVLAAVLGALFALVDTVAVVAVLPLVSLVTGVSPEDAGVGWAYEWLGEPPVETFAVFFAVAIVVTFIVKDVASLWFSWWQSGVIAEQRLAASVEMMRDYLAQPVPEFRVRSTAEMIRMINEAVSQVFNQLVAGILQVTTAGFTIIMIAIALIVVSPIATLGIIVLFVVVIAAYSAFARPRVLRAGRRQTEASVQSYIAALHGFGAFKEIRLRNTTQYFVDGYERAVNDAVRAGRVAGFFGGAPKYLLEIAFIAAIGALVVIQSLSGSDTGIIGLLALFVAAGFRLLPNVSAALAGLNSIRFGSASLQVVHEERVRLAETPSISQSSTSTRTPLEQAIELRDVTYTYPGSNEPAVNGVSLQIAQGSSVAIVGASGGGKTTLADIVLGLISPDEGSVLVDGTDVRGDVVAWQQSTAMVAQDVYLTGWTVADNIVFDEPRSAYDHDRLVEVVRLAQLEDVVASLPEGMDTMLGERGGRLSGGQRQRVGIARALYRNPEVIVLDEATSALDNDTERRITTAIESLHGDITVVIIAHRLSTVRNVDQIVYMEDGRVSATGTFDELLITSPGFAHLVKLGDLGAKAKAEE